MWTLVDSFTHCPMKGCKSAHSNLERVRHLRLSKSWRPLICPPQHNSCGSAPSATTGGHKLGLCDQPKFANLNDFHETWFPDVTCLTALQTLAGIGLPHSVHHCATWHAAEESCRMAGSAQLSARSGLIHGWNVVRPTETKGQLLKKSRFGSANTGELHVLGDCSWSPLAASGRARL